METINEKVRQDFPALNQEINHHPLVYLDNGATTQKPSVVLQEIAQFYEKNNANVHRSVHTLSARSTHAYEESRQVVQKFIGASYPEEVIFTSGTTESINQIMHGYVLPLLQPGDEIVVSALEHHSNLIPWQVAAKITGAHLRYIELTENGEIETKTLASVLSRKTKIVAISHVSNVLGTIQPIREICQMAHKEGAVVIVDGAQAVPHQKIDVNELDADFYVFSGHKLYGPTGIGVLYGKKEHLEKMQPSVYGGEMITRVGDFESTWAPLPHKLEAGTPNIAGAVGLAAAINYLNNIGFKQLLEAEAKVYHDALEKLQKIKDLEIYGPTSDKNRVGVISFNLKGIHPHDLATALDLQGIAIRAGHHCAQPLMRRLNQIATARVSFAVYNTLKEVDFLVKALQEVREFFVNGY